MQMFAKEVKKISGILPQRYDMFSFQLSTKHLFVYILFCLLNVLINVYLNDF